MSPSDSKINTEELTSNLKDTSRSTLVVNEEENYLDNDVINEIQGEKLKSLKEYNKTLKQNNEERKKYAGWIFRLTCFWAFLIFVILFLQGFKVMLLSDSILITLITSTTINFFGFFLLVVKYLFNTNSDKVKEKEI